MSESLAQRMQSPPAQQKPASLVYRLIRYWPILILLAGLICPLVFSTWYTFNKQRNLLIRTFDLENEQLSEVLANGLREAIWNLTPALGQPVIDSVMRDERVVAIRVVSDLQGDFAAAVKAHAKDRLTERIERAVFRNDEHIGFVELEFDRTAIDAQLDERWPEIYFLGGLQGALAFGVVALFFWILRRREHEKVLREVNRRLSEEVAARTRELEEAHTELLRTESLAVLGRLTATVSHELRHPLGTMQMSLSVIENQIQGMSPEEESKRSALGKAFARANRSIARCTGIVDDLLEFTRAGNLRQEATDIDVWLSGVVSEFDVPDALRLHTRLQAGANVFCDRERLRGVLLNLLSNAIHAMTPGPGVDPAGVLSVSTRVNNGRVEIVVQDTGEGIAPDIRSKVFEPLFSTRSFGFGLGLPLVKQVMEAHSGGVEIGSVTEGAQVLIWLPIMPPDEAEHASP